MSKTILITGASSGIGRATALELLATDSLRGLASGTLTAEQAAGPGQRRKETPMQITRDTLDTNPGPSEWFTGAVYIDTVAAPSEDSRIGAACVRFAPGARTAWHTHPHGQTIWVAEGIGLCQREGGPVEVIRPGDRVFFEPGENHWHGAAATRFMTHIAMQQANEAGEVVSWGEHVSDDQYGQAPSTTDGES